LGLTGDLGLKPQLSGLGGEVYSTISSFTSGNQHLSNAYTSLSGTSMACPYVAGYVESNDQRRRRRNLRVLFRALALYLSHLGENRRLTFSELLNRFQSNANPVNLANSSLLASVAQQGAGLINAFQTLTATTLISPSELALNDTVRTKKFYTVLVTNIGEEAAQYTVSHRGAALATGAKEGNDQLLSKPVYSADYAVS
jgi:minor extracellular serine protease Vpr